MPRGADVRRLYERQIAPATILTPVSAPYAAELCELRRDLDKKWATFNEITDPLLADAAYREVLAADARLQALVVRAQKEMAS